jgi:hypothetical protein
VDARREKNLQTRKAQSATGELAAGNELKKWFEDVAHRLRVPEPRSANPCHCVEFDTEEFAAKNRESEAPNRLNRDRKSNTPPPKRRGGGKGPTTVGPPNAGDADKKQSSEASYSGVPIDLCYGASNKRHLHLGSGLQTRIPMSCCHERVFKKLEHSHKMANIRQTRDPNLCK